MVIIKLHRKHWVWQSCRSNTKHEIRHKATVPAHKAAGPIHFRSDTHQVWHKFDSACDCLFTIWPLCCNLSFLFQYFKLTMQRKLRFTSFLYRDICPRTASEITKKCKAGLYLDFPFWLACCTFVVCLTFVKSHFNVFFADTAQEKNKRVSPFQILI